MDKDALVFLAGDQGSIPHWNDNFFFIVKHFIVSSLLWRFGDFVNNV